MKKRKTDTDGELDFRERAAMQTIKAGPPASWGPIMWRALDTLGTAASGRLLYAALQRCSELEQPPTAEMMVRLKRRLLPPGDRGSRDAPRDRDAMQKAAQFEAQHPMASLREIAKAAGVKSPNTVDAWRKAEHGEYRKILGGEKTLVALAEKSLALERGFCPLK
jgi:hypothetical protein